MRSVTIFNSIDVFVQRVFPFYVPLESKVNHLLSIFSTVSIYVRVTSRASESTILDNTAPAVYAARDDDRGRRANARMSRDAPGAGPIRDGGCSPRPNGAARTASRPRTHTHKLNIYPEEPRDRRALEHAGRLR